MAIISVFPSYPAHSIHRVYYKPRSQFLEAPIPLITAAYSFEKNTPKAGKNHFYPLINGR